MTECQALLIKSGNKMFKLSLSNSPTNKSIEKSDITSEASSVFLLDYACKKDFPAFYASVMKESAMAEIYLENEILPKETVTLFDMQGKSQCQDSNRWDLMLVLRHKEKLIGYIEIRLIRDKDVSSKLFALFVHDEYRRRGIGNLLMLYALRLFLNTGESTMTVSYTADSLPLYNKFGFYPPDKDSDELVDWFKMNDDKRLDQLKDEPSEHLVLDLRNRACRELFDDYCRKLQSKLITYGLSENLKSDLQMNRLSKETSDSNSSGKLLVKRGLGILSTTPYSGCKKEKIKEGVAEFSSVAKVLPS